MHFTVLYPFLAFLHFAVLMGKVSRRDSAGAEHMRSAHLVEVAIRSILLESWNPQKVRSGLHNLQNGRRARSWMPAPAPKERGGFTVLSCRMFSAPRRQFIAGCSLHAFEGVHQAIFRPKDTMQLAIEVGEVELTCQCWFWIALVLDQ